MFGMPHPIALTLGPPMMWGMIIFFVLSEVLSLTISMVAVSGPKHRHLMKWALSLPFYFPMATLAAYKGLHEFVVRPFYWDKTMHGVPVEGIEPEEATFAEKPDIALPNARDLENADFTHLPLVSQHPVSGAP